MENVSVPSAGGLDFFPDLLLYLMCVYYVRSFEILCEFEVECECEFEFEFELEFEFSRFDFISVPGLRMGL